MTAKINRTRYTLAGALIATFAGLAASGISRRDAVVLLLRKWYDRRKIWTDYRTDSKSS